MRPRYKRITTLQPCQVIDQILEGLIEKSDMGINERIKRLSDFREKLKNTDNTNGTNTSKQNVDDISESGY